MFVKPSETKTNQTGVWSNPKSEILLQNMYPRSQFMDYQDT